MAQQFDTVDVLRLEVEDDPTGLVNLVQNPSGELGGWAWVTPLTDSTIEGEDTPAALFYRRTVAGASYFYTEPMPVTAGEYVAGTYTTIGTGPAHYQRARFEYLDSSLAVLSSSTQTALSGVSGTFNLGPFLAPASTAYVRLRFDVYTSGGANPTGTNFIYVSDVTVAKAATSGALGSIRKNLVPNPSFETNATGWTGGALTSVARSTAQAHTGTASLAITAGSVSASAATLEGRSGIPVTGGAEYTASAYVRAATAGRSGYLSIYWYNAAGSYMSASNGVTFADVTSGWTRFSATKTAPVGATFATVRVWLTGTVASEVHYVDAVMFEQASSLGSYFDSATADGGGVTYDPATQSPVVSVRTNLCTNPSMETNATGWTGGTNTTVARVTSPAGDVGAACLSLTRTTSTGYVVARGSNPNRVAAVHGDYFGFSVRIRSAATSRSVLLGFAYYDAGGAYLGLQSASTGTTTVVGAWTTMGVNRYVNLTAYPTAAFIAPVVEIGLCAVGEVHYIDAVMFESTSTSFPVYFDGATADGTADFTTIDRAWTGTANASTSTETTTVTLPYSTATASNLAYIEPVPYLNILGPTLHIDTDRTGLDVNILSATIADSTLDPSQSDLVRPGRRCRLMALDGGTDTWKPLFTGKVTRASVEYHLKDPALPESKRARITLTAVDPNAPLANTKRAEGVATLDDLPYVLEGCGVPWNVNGSGNQVASATVVALNDNASALDQVAVTRDSNLGYAWVDPEGVLQVWDHGTTFGTVDLTTADYTDLGVDYDTDRCINEVTIKFLRLNPVTGDTEEVPYGPYRNETSIAEWGVRSKSFTVQGLSEETSDIPDLAAAILAANSTPEVTVNSVTVAVDEASKIGAFLIGTDLYDTAQVEKPDAGYYDDVRVTRIKHRITPTKWQWTLDFEAHDGVASPTFVPSPTTGAGGKTLGQLLCPVGKIDSFICAKVDIPAGWLPLDGATFDAAVYPDLYAMLGNSNTLPDFTDRFMIGAGSKALLTTGGAPTKVLTAANLPPHAHTINHGHTGFKVSGTFIRWIASQFATGTAKNGYQPGAGADPVIEDFNGNSGNGPGTSTPVDILNPWVAVWPCVRAA